MIDEIVDKTRMAVPVAATQVLALSSAHASVEPQEPTIGISRPIVSRLSRLRFSQTVVGRAAASAWLVGWSSAQGTQPKSAFPMLEHGHVAPQFYDAAGRPCAR